MSKRELRAGAGMGEGSRLKRQRKEMIGEESSDVDLWENTGEGSKYKGDVHGLGRGDESIREQGLKLWQTVKDAVNKEGRLIAVDFLRKPPKRLYPDYYKIIQKPIALDDIKKRLDSDAYPSLESVRLDFELCFNNAKQYNMKDSEIWKSAKELLKLVHKTYNSLQPSTEDDDDDDGDGRKGKSKTPNLTRLMNKRLQKLVEKTDESGRPLSTEFMALPDRREWQIYYKQIKHPQCIDNIFKRVRRKEYPSIGDFVADVELVFSNAMTFNQEHTQIWEDARTLRDFFRQLMVDVAPSDQSKVTNGKLKIKMPASQTASSNQPSLLLRVPGLSSNAKYSQAPSAPMDAATPAKTAPSTVPAAVTSIEIPPAAATSPATTAPTPASTSTSLSPRKATTHALRGNQASAAATTSSVRQASSKPPASQPPQPILPAKAIAPSPATPKVPNLAPVPAQLAVQQNPQYSYTPHNLSHYPNATYHLPATPARTPSVAPQAPTLSTNLTQSVSVSPAPAPMHPSHQLKSVLIRTEPLGRTIHLNHSDGVKCWMFRLERGDIEIHVSDVTFLGDEEEGSSSEEDTEDRPEKQEEEEDEEDFEPEPPSRNTRKKKGKGRGRPRGSGRAAALAKARAAKAAKKKTPTMKIGDLEVKLNGVAIEADEGGNSSWTVKLGIGMNTVEIGEQGGMIWKVYAERPRD